MMITLRRKLISAFAATLFLSGMSLAAQQGGGGKKLKSSQGIIYQMMPTPGDDGGTPAPRPLGELVTSVSTYQGSLSVYKSSFIQMTGGSLRAVLNYAFDDGTVLTVSYTALPDGSVSYGGASAALDQKIALLPAFKDGLQQQYQTATGGQGVPKRPWGCGLSWLALAWNAIAHDPIGILTSLYSVGCNCFGWCF